MLREYLIKGFIILTICLLIIGTRMVYLQRSHFMAADKYYQEANWKLAISEYDKTMHFYTPWSPYLKKSAQKLWQIGEMFENEKKFDWAHTAYSTIRSSFYSARSLYTPGRDWISRCDAKIADLNVQMLIRDGVIHPKAAEAERKRQLHVLTVDRVPDPFWSVIVEAGLFGWIGSVLFLIMKGLSAEGKIQKKFALYGILSFLCTFTMWITALLKA
jgi:hypothetical protein